MDDFSPRWAMAYVLGLAASVWLAGCVSATTDCNQMCKMPQSTPPTDACELIDGEHRCVALCSSDNDCDSHYYSGCTATADDGTKICEDSSDAGR